MNNIFSLLILTLVVLALLPSCDKKHLALFIVLMAMPMAANDNITPSDALHF